jgi:GNAT superfamily N-acetyltransferase
VSVWTRADGYSVSDERERVDRARVHGWIAHQTPWGAGVGRKLFERTVDGSMCFSLFAPDGAQVGYARVVSDRASFGYLADVFVDPAERGKGLSLFLLDTIFAHPELQGFRRWVLATRDAHALYARYGFAQPHLPGSFMERYDAQAYPRSAAQD